MPLALILNELLTNAVKYGSNGGAETHIRVGLKDADGFELYVEDDGPGFDLESVKNQSSGLKLVQLLARQLRGQLEVSMNPPAAALLLGLQMQGDTTVILVTGTPFKPAALVGRIGSGC